MEEVERLSALPCLESLLLADNPVAQLSGFRIRVFKAFIPLNPTGGGGGGGRGSGRGAGGAEWPQVKLDGRKATREEAAAAADAARKAARDNVRFPCSLLFLFRRRFVVSQRCLAVPS